MTPRREFGTVFRRKGSRRWSIRYRVSKREVVVPGFASKKDAASALIRIRAELSKARALGTRPVGRRTFAEFGPDFLAFMRRKHRPTTIQQNETIWKGVILPAWGDTVLADVTRAQVEAWLIARATGASSRGKSLSQATMNRNLSMLSQLFRLAIDRGLALENPVTGIRRGREPEKEYPYLSEEDVARIAKHAGDLAPLVIILAGTGIRYGEAARLRWSDVYLRANDHGAGELVVRESKSGKSRRVGLQIHVAAAFESLNLARSGSDPTDVVFPALSQHDRATILRWFKRACVAAGLPPVRLHDLRHFFGTYLTRSGVPLPDVAAILGHTSIAVTMRYSKHAPHDATSRAIRLLDERRLARGTEKGTDVRDEAKERT